jgi:hypothetical protein
MSWVGQRESSAGRGNLIAFIKSDEIALRPTRFEAARN